MPIDELMPILKSIWTVWFFAFFVFLVGWALLPSRRQKLQSHANIPLQDERPRDLPKE